VVENRGVFPVLIYFSKYLYIEVDNNFFERVEKFKYLGTTLNKQNFVQEEIKNRLKTGNACYHSVQNVLFSGLLSKNVKIDIYRNIILPVVLYGCETWSLAMREERRLRVVENRVLRRVFGPKRDDVIGERRKLPNKHYCAGDKLEKNEMGRACSSF
jgi:hypothetical protein